jgi:hypothetical protein
MSVCVHWTYGTSRVALHPNEAIVRAIWCYAPGHLRMDLQGELSAAPADRTPHQHLAGSGCRRMGGTTRGPEGRLTAKKGSARGLPNHPGAKGKKQHQMQSENYSRLPHKSTQQTLAGQKNFRAQIEDPTYSGRDRVPIPNWLGEPLDWRGRENKLSHAQRQAYRVLCLYADFGTGRVNVRHSVIARDLHYKSTRNSRMVLSELIAAGVLKLVEKRHRRAQVWQLSGYPTQANRLPFTQVPRVLINAAHLHNTTKDLLVAYFSFQGVNNFCWPTRQQLIERSGISSRQFIRAQMAAGARNWLTLDPPEAETDALDTLAENAGIYLAGQKVRVDVGDDVPFMPCDELDAWLREQSVHAPLPSVTAGVTSSVTAENPAESQENPSVTAEDEARRHDPLSDGATILQGRRHDPPGSALRSCHPDQFLPEKDLLNTLFFPEQSAPAGDAATLSEIKNPIQESEEEPTQEKEEDAPIGAAVKEEPRQAPAPIHTSCRKPTDSIQDDFLDLPVDITELRALLQKTTDPHQQTRISQAMIAARKRGAHHIPRAEWRRNHDEKIPPAPAKGTHPGAINPADGGQAPLESIPPL